MFELILKYLFIIVFCEFAVSLIHICVIVWFLCQVPATAVQGSRNFHFSIYGKKKSAKVSDDVSSSGCLTQTLTLSGFIV